MKDTATTVMECCVLLANIGEEPGLLVRPYGSQAMREANNIVAGWMRTAGMTTRQDEIGNLIGRYEGTGEKTLILGSHLDTVRDAGKYDGQLGVMVALACVQRLRNRGERLPHAGRWCSLTRRACALALPSWAASCTPRPSIQKYLRR